MALMERFQYVEAKSFDVEDGTHDVVIMDAVEKFAKSGKEMVCITLRVADSNFVPYIHNIVDGEYFDRTMSIFCDCFGLGKTPKLSDFKGKKGRATFEHKERKWTDDQGFEKTSKKAEIIRFEPRTDEDQKEDVKKTSSVPNPVPQFSALNEEKELGF